MASPHYESTPTWSFRTLPTLVAALIILTSCIPGQEAVISINPYPNHQHRGIGRPASGSCDCRCPSVPSLPCDPSMSLMPAVVRSLRSMPSVSSLPTSPSLPQMLPQSPHPPTSVIMSVDTVPDMPSLLFLPSGQEPSPKPTASTMPPRPPISLMLSAVESVPAEPSAPPRLPLPSVKPVPESPSEQFLPSMSSIPHLSSISSMSSAGFASFVSSMSPSVLSMSPSVPSVPEVTFNPSEPTPPTPPTTFETTVMTTSTGSETAEAEVTTVTLPSSPPSTAPTPSSSPSSSSNDTTETTTEPPRTEPPTTEPSTTEPPTTINPTVPVTPPDMLSMVSMPSLASMPFMPSPISMPVTPPIEVLEATESLPTMPPVPSLRPGLLSTTLAEPRVTTMRPVPIKPRPILVLRPVKTVFSTPSTTEWTTASKGRWLILRPFTVVSSTSTESTQPNEPNEPDEPTVSTTPAVPTASTVPTLPTSPNVVSVSSSRPKTLKPVENGLFSYISSVADSPELHYVDEVPNLKDKSLLCEFNFRPMDLVFLLADQARAANLSPKQFEDHIREMVLNRSPMSDTISQRLKNAQKKHRGDFFVNNVTDINARLQRLRLERSYNISSRCHGPESVTPTRLMMMFPQHLNMGQRPFGRPSVIKLQTQNLRRRRIIPAHTPGEVKPSRPLFIPEFMTHREFGGLIPRSGLPRETRRKLIAVHLFTQPDDEKDVSLRTVCMLLRWRMDRSLASDESRIKYLYENDVLTDEGELLGEVLKWSEVVVTRSFNEQISWDLFDLHVPDISPFR